MTYNYVDCVRARRPLVSEAIRSDAASVCLQSRKINDSIGFEIGPNTYRVAGVGLDQVDHRDTDLKSRRKV